MQIRRSEVISRTIFNVTVSGRFTRIEEGLNASQECSDNNVNVNYEGPGDYRDRGGEEEEEDK